MSGGSLGLRAGSYGSLQQSLPNSFVVTIHTVRKPSRFFSGSRERVRFLPWIFRCSSSRQLAMLYLVPVSITIFFVLMLTITKDVHIPEARAIYPSSAFLVHTRGFRNRIMSSHYASPKISTEKNSDGGTEYGFSSKVQSLRSKNRAPPLRSHPPPPVVLTNESAVLLRHPCDTFGVPPPPPADRKRTGPRPCPVCYLPVEQAMAYMPTLPSVSPILKNLTYVIEDSPSSPPSFGGSPFGGYPSLKQRNDSFDIKDSMCVHCGFVKGNRPGHQTGFDIDDADLLEMEGCSGIVVASAIFGNYDIIQQPRNISEAAKKNVCFYMFVDEETEAGIKNSGALHNTNMVGLWRVVLVRNLPYTDPRRTGKVPKLLLHRMFPNARFSIWIDGKLELVVDPYQILERFLWRENASFAISRHYKRFDVFEEAEANKAAGKYDNASIDFQVKFYMQEGLTHYSPAKLPITSDVPEGCVIIREHIPITNLFTCLWFSEVDRFTSRDQISFSTVRDKIISKVDWSINMFMDCERRNFVVQAYHRDILELKHTVVPPPSLTEGTSENSPPTKIVRTKNVKRIRKVKHGIYKSGTRSVNGSRSVNGRDTSSF